MTNQATDQPEQVREPNRAESKPEPLTPADIALFAKLATFCASSYHWTPKSFRNDVKKDGKTSCRRFVRKPGAFRWRLFALLSLPASAVALLFSFSVAVVAFVVFLPFEVQGLNNVLIYSYGGSPLEWLLDKASSISRLVWNGLLLLAPICRFLSDILAPIAHRIWDVMEPEFQFVSMVLTPFVRGISAFLTATGRLLPEWLLACASFAGWLVDCILFETPVALEAFVQTYSPAWFFPFFLGIRFVTGAAALAGLCVAGFLLCLPKFASARAYGYIDPESRSAVIVFCGSTRGDNFTINAHVWQSLFPLYHCGFRRSWLHIRQDIVDWLNEFKPDIDNVVTTGHSLGGAVAEVAAFDLSRAAFPVRSVVSFGSSRIGGRRMRRDYNASAVYPHTYHLTHDEDAIPRLPPALFFKHVGRRFTLSRDGILEEKSTGPIFQQFRELVRRETTLAAAADFDSNDGDNPIELFFLASTALFSVSSRGRSLAKLRRSDTGRNCLILYKSVRSIFSKNIPVLKKAALALLVLNGFLDHTFTVVFWIHKLWIVLLGFGVYVAGLLVYYVRTLGKGMARDHFAGLYRKALNPKPAENVKPGVQTSSQVPQRP